MITTPSQQTRSPTAIPLLAICLGYFMTILDVTIVNVALVDIKEHLSANVTGLQWIVDGYALVFASFLLTGGALGDRRGSRTVFLAGLALFTLASTLLVLQIARAFQGLGAALLVPNSLALLNTTFPDAQKRAWAIGIWAAVASIGALSGPLLGGVLVNAFGWRSPRPRVGSCMGLHVRTRQQTAQMWELPTRCATSCPSQMKRLQIALCCIHGFGTEVALLPGRQPTTGEERQVLRKVDRRSSPS